MKQHTEETRDTLRVIRFPELHRKIGLCRSQVWRLEQQGDFPKSIPLGKNSKGWIEADVNAWLEARRGGAA